MAILKTGTNSGSGFSSGEQVTATKLNNSIDAGKFVNESGNPVTPTGNGTCTVNQGLEVSSSTGQLQIKNGGIAFAKLSTTPTTDLAALTATGYYGIINAIYPIGSIYMSYTNSGDPDDILFGGLNHTTWVRIEGKVLAGYNNTSGTFNHAPNATDGTGGDETITLTASQIPTHNHLNTASPGAASRTVWHDSQSGYGTNRVSHFGSGSSFAGRSTMGQLVVNFGGGGSHDNLQPYQIVYMWRRTV